MRVKAKDPDNWWEFQTAPANLAAPLTWSSDVVRQAPNIAASDATSFAGGLAKWVTVHPVQVE